MAPATTNPDQRSIVNREGGLGSGGAPNVNIDAGGVSISHQKHGIPTSVRNFSYRRTIQNAANRMQVTMFDQHEEFIEKEIINNRTDIYFSYGYSGGPQTTRIKGVVMDYTPTFLASGVEINLDVLSVFGGDGARLTATHEGKISDIVRNIANENGWRVDVDDTKVVPAQSNLDSSAPGEAMFQQAGQTDLGFLSNVLSQQAVRASDGVGGYVVYFDDLANTLHFHPPRLDGEIVREYTWRGNAQTDQQVIRFAPSIQGKIMGVMGASGVASQNEDPNTGESSNVTVDSASTSGNRQSLGSSIGDLGRSNTSGLVLPAPSAAAAEALSEALWYKLFNQVYKAELIVQGDPFIPVGGLVNVWVMLKSGLPHYTSGTYLILEARDDIQGGNFRTTLSLAKNAVRKGDPAGGTKTGK